MGPKELLEELLRRSPEVRIAIANELLDSADDEPEDVTLGVDVAWAAEIRRRVDELRSGRVKGVP